MTTTWLRIVTYTVDKSASDTHEALEECVQDGVRLLDGRPGYRGGEWGYDADSGMFAAVTNWATREAIEAVSDELEKLHQTRREQGLSVAAAANLRLVTTPLTWSPQDWAAITSRTSSSWIRVAFYSAPDVRGAAYLEQTTDRTGAMLKGMPGFRAGYWGVDPVSGDMAAITYWSSSAAIEAAQHQLDGLHAERARNGLVSGPVANFALLHVQTAPGAAAQGRF